MQDYGVCKMFSAALIGISKICDKVQIVRVYLREETKKRASNICKVIQELKKPKNKN